MRLLLCVLALVLVGSTLAGYNRRVRRADDGKCKDPLIDMSEQEFDKLFEKLLADLGEEGKEVTGEGSSVTDEQRRALLKAALQKYKEYEADKQITYSLQINKYAIMTEDELNQKTGIKMTDEEEHFKRQLQKKHQMKYRDSMRKRAAPARVNHCATTGPVEDQGSCGSCWAFAATHALGGRMRLRDGGDKVFRISEQQPTDCTYTYTGCNGGQSYHAWRLFKEKNISTDFTYPYNSIYNGASKCEASSGRMNAFFQDDYVETPPDNDVQAIKNHVAEGPVVVYMRVNLYGFGSVGDGIYDPPLECNNGSINHAMVLCGYDTDASTGKDYWLIKNSWGTNWGDSGYIKVAMGKNACKMEQYIYVPQLQTTQTDTSQVCVEAKSCSSDADCNNIRDACVSGACKCRTCVANVVCVTDADCGGEANVCVYGGEGSTARRRSKRQVNESFRRCNCAGESVVSESVVSESVVSQSVVSQSVVSQSVVSQSVVSQSTPPDSETIRTPGKVCNNVETDSDCAYWATKEYCTLHYQKFMEKNCRKTCGRCPDRSNNGTTTVTYSSTTPGAQTSGAHTSGAHTTGAYTSGVYTSEAYTSGPYTSGAHTSGSYTSGAHTSGAHTSEAHTSGAYTSGAYTSGAYTSGLYTSSAYTSGPYTSGAHTSQSYTSGGHSSGAYTSGYHTSGGFTSGNYTSGAYSTSNYASTNNYNNSDSVSCGTNQWQCADGKQCILYYYECDYYSDCSDKSDEHNCPCKDVQSWCASWKAAGYCTMASYKYFMTSQCKQTCGFC